MSSNAVASPTMSPRTRLMPAAAICCGERVHRLLVVPEARAERRIADAAQVQVAVERAVRSDRRRRAATGVLNVKSGPNWSSATADVYIFIVDAGCIIASAFCEKSVSPRVSETTIAPHVPPRVWLDQRRCRPRSASALAPSRRRSSAGLARIAPAASAVAGRRGRSARSLTACATHRRDACAESGTAASARRARDDDAIRACTSCIGHEARASGLATQTLKTIFFR